MNDVLATHSPLPSGKSLLLLLFGSRLSPSPSPAFHTARLAQAGLDVHMLPAELDGEAAFRVLLASLLPVRNFLGANVTAPFKAAALAVPGLACEPEVSRLGAANTVFRSASGWRLGNTDLHAFAESLDGLLARRPGSRWRVHVLGAGGVGCVAAEVCRRRQDVESLRIWTRDWPHAERARSYWQVEGRVPGLLPCVRGELSQAASAIAREALAPLPGDAASVATLLVNTLPLGYGGGANPVAEEVLRALAATERPAAFYDVLYERTPAVALAEALGMPTLNGRRMWELQAEAALGLWRASLA